MPEPNYYAVVLKINLPAFDASAGWQPGDVIEIREAARAHTTKPFLSGDKAIAGLAIVPMTLTDSELLSLREGRAQIDLLNIPEAVDGNITEPGGKTKDRVGISPLGGLVGG